MTLESEGIPSTRVLSPRLILRDVCAPALLIVLVLDIFPPPLLLLISANIPPQEINEWRLRAREFEDEDGTDDTTADDGTDNTTDDPDAVDNAAAGTEITTAERQCLAVDENGALTVQPCDRSSEQTCGVGAPAMADDATTVDNSATAEVSATDGSTDDTTADDSTEDPRQSTKMPVLPEPNFVGIQTSKFPRFCWD
ncbi:hypothetical protein B0H17DRAFT_1190113 [Mycena rosella]|uniref:Uncharacterized protein n=1 Tax=Mycena rosella TaxID=1033263 RepID=A0AAD7H1V0_MYCRO|nr:hypothetical protein B0H17DRAFT_1190113 [Mycena rosella]